MNGRIYDPLIGRFLSADPLIQAPMDLQSYNRYSYVKNNPLTLTDPTGFSWWDDAMAWAAKTFGVGNPRGGSSQGDRASNDGEDKLANESARNGVMKAEKGLEKIAGAETAVIKGTPILGTVVSGTQLVTGKNPLDPTGNIPASRMDAGIEVGVGVFGGKAAEEAGSFLSGLVKDISSEVAGLSGALKGLEKASVQPVSGGDIKVIGRLADTAVAKEWAGHEVLSLPNWTPAKNAEWVASGIKNGQAFYTASPEAGNLIQSSGRFAGQPTTYSQEISQLKAAGYVKVGDYYVPGSQAATFKP